MKKTLNISLLYMIFALVCGVFYREYTKLMAFSGTTSLAFTHLHLFALGTILFLVLTLFCMQTTLAQQKAYQRFLIIYNIALPFMVIMMIVRGILQVHAVELSPGMNAMISGIAGISHILMAVGLAFLFIALRKSIQELENKS